MRHANRLRGKEREWGRGRGGFMADFYAAMPDSTTRDSPFGADYTYYVLSFGLDFWQRQARCTCLRIFARSAAKATHCFGVYAARRQWPQTQVSKYFTVNHVLLKLNLHGTGAREPRMPYRCCAM